MRTVLIAMALLATGACASTKATSSGASGVSGVSATRADAAGAVGAGSAKAAVEGFLNAVKSQDLQGMSGYWGTEKGLARDQMSRDDLEKRLVIIQCNLMHDGWSFTGESKRIVRAGEEDLGIELRQKQLRAKTDVVTVRGPNGRWFVYDVDLKPLNQFCR